jgi:DNA-directed RNA polymerase specialized sigma24 family protein
MSMGMVETTMSFAELLRRCQDNDPEAWAAFTAWSQPVLERLARWHLARYQRQGESRVEEVVSEVWCCLLDQGRSRLRAYVAKQDCRGASVDPVSFEAHLSGMVRSRIQCQVRGEKRRHHHEEEAAHQQALAAIPSQPQDRAQLQEMIDRMPPALREVGEDTVFGTPGALAALNVSPAALRQRFCQLRQIIHQMQQGRE